MKTTNFEISKKLKEIGFEADFNFHYKATDSSNLYDSGYEDYIERNTPAYDLETLLDALPTFIKKNKKNYLLFFSKDTVGYYATSLKLDYENIQLHDYIFELYIHHESLADTAGRMLIQLYEAGIVNFNK